MALEGNLMGNVYGILLGLVFLVPVTIFTYWRVRRQLIREGRWEELKEKNRKEQWTLRGY